MEEKKNFNFEEVIRLSSILEYEPMYDDVYITLNTEKEDGNNILSSDIMSETQYVIAKGERATQVTVGQKVIIDLDKMTVSETDPNNVYEKITRIQIKPIEISGHMFAIISERMIKGKEKNQ